jgi:hypothetical protein
VERLVARGGQGHKGERGSPKEVKQGAEAKWPQVAAAPHANTRAPN